MADPTDSQRTYVRAALELQGYQFSEARIAEITVQFARIESVAASILAAEGPETEVCQGTAPVFRP